MATEVPVTIIDMASEERSGAATRTANGVATDQKTACAAATTSRETTSSSKVGATAEPTCPAANMASTPTMSARGDTLLAATMSGNDSSATAQA